VLMLLCVVSLLWTFRAPDNLVEIVALDGDVTWVGRDAKGETTLAVGRSLPAGPLESTGPDSWIALAFEDGTSISVAGPANLTFSEVDDQKIIQLRRGTVSIEATRQDADRPLRVLTPSAEAEVLGTQFNVTADELNTRLTVNEGLVRVKRLADGRVEEVGADEMLVAALEKDTDFRARPRSDFADSWISDLHRDRLQGEWSPSENVLFATPHLWKGERDDPESPVLLHTVVLDPSAGSRPPLRIAEDARIRVSGRIDRPHRVYLGMATNLPRGGFAGKYALPGGESVVPDSEGRFEFEVEVAELQSKKDEFPAKPTGHELVYLWIQTLKTDVGLAIDRVKFH